MSGPENDFIYYYYYKIMDGGYTMYIIITIILFSGFLLSCSPTRFAGVPPTRTGYEQKLSIMYTDVV